jgi:hypothetical protein
MWEKCVSCGAGLFTGDAFCGNCGRPTTSPLPAAREAAAGQSAPPDIAPEPIRPQPIAPQPIAPELIPPDFTAPRRDAAPEFTPPDPFASEPARPESFTPNPAAPEPARSEPAQPEPAGPAMPADEEAAPQLELGLGLAPALRAPAPAAANGQLAPATATAGQPEHVRPESVTDAADPDGLAGLDREAEPGGPDGLNRQAGIAGQAGRPGVAGQAEMTGQAGQAEAGQAEMTGQAGQAEMTGQAGQAEMTGQAGQGGVAGQADTGGEGAGLPEPELLVIPARQVGGPAGPGGRLTVPAQRRGQPGQPDRQAETAARVPARTRLTGQANLDPAANSRFLLRVGRQAALFAGIYLLTETVALIVLLSLGFTGLGLHAALRLEIGSLWLAALAVAIPFWIIPVPALLGQWTMLVESSADASGAAFEHIATAFRDHDVPLDSLDVRAVSPPHECPRDYLELRRGRFSGFISCFPHGRDLYVGWTFFLRMSPGRLMLWSIGRSVQHVTRRGGDIQRALWFESTRALVAAMHSAALAGVSAAVSVPDSAAETADRPDDVVVKFG